MAARLAGVFGTEPDIWINLQAQHDLWQVRQRARPKGQAAGCLRAIPHFAAADPESTGNRSFRYSGWRRSQCRTRHASRSARLIEFHQIDPLRASSSWPPRPVALRNSQASSPSDPVPPHRRQSGTRGCCHCSDSRTTPGKRSATISTSAAARVPSRTTRARPSASRSSSPPSARPRPLGARFQ